MTTPGTALVTMHIKTRRSYALLYRSTWVPKGSAGNTHGYTRQRYVGSIPLSAAAIPSELQTRLTPDEIAFVEARVCQPAGQRADAERRAAEQRENDPGWRIEEASRLLCEAAERSGGHAIQSLHLDVLQQELAKLLAKGGNRATESLGSSDPLGDSLTAIRSAARAVTAGRYGKAPTEGVRTTRTYRAWAQLLEAVQGESDGSLLRALQDKGYVKRRGK